MKIIALATLALLLMCTFAASNAAEDFSDKKINYNKFMKIFKNQVQDLFNLYA